jgi:hypothetical protein
MYRVLSPCGYALVLCLLTLVSIVVAKKNEPGISEP